MQQIYEQGQVVPIALPTNEFGGQEPGDNIEINQYYQNKFGITFPITSKIDLQHKFFQTYGTPDWNFNKYLIDENGKLIGYWASAIDPLSDSILNKITN